MVGVTGNRVQKTSGTVNRPRERQAPDSAQAHSWGAAAAILAGPPIEAAAL